MLLARAEPMHPPAPVMRTILSELDPPSGLTRSWLCGRTVGKGEKHAIVYGHRASEKRSRTRPWNSDAGAVAAERRSGGLCVGRGGIAGLHRDARRFWHATRCATACIADKNLSIAAIGGCARRGLRLRSRLAGAVAWHNREESDEAPRCADRRQNAFRAFQRPIGIDRDKLGG